METCFFLSCVFGIKSLPEVICCATDAWRYDSFQIWELPEKLYSRTFMLDVHYNRIIALHQTHILIFQFGHYVWRRLFKGEILSIETRMLQIQLLERKTMQCFSSITLNRESRETISNGFWAKFWFFHFNRLNFLFISDFCRICCKYITGFTHASPQHANVFYVGGCWCLALKLQKPHCIDLMCKHETYLQRLISDYMEKAQFSEIIKHFLVVKIIMGHYVVFHTEMLFDTYRAISLWCVCDKKSNRTNLDQQNFKSCWHPIFFFYCDLSDMLTFVVLMS